MTDNQKKTYIGIVQRRPFGGTTKSQHDAIVLVTDSNEIFKLRIAGGNAFNDKNLHRFLGKCVRIEATEISGSTLLADKASDITVLNNPKHHPRSPKP